MEDGEVIHVYGDHPVGVISYDKSGHMSVHLMTPHRVNFEKADKALCTAAEAEAAIRSYDAYFGTYEVDEVRKIITHHVIGSLLPNWSGTAQPRFYDFSGNRLILTTKEILYAGRKVRGFMTWQRI
jgi:hypothetical protein